MFIYIFNALSLLFYYYISSKAKNGKKLFVVLASLQMFLILSLRVDTLGVDLGAYKAAYLHISNYSFSELFGKLHFFKTADIGYQFESGYVLLNWIVAKLGFQFHALLVVLAFIHMLSAGRFYYRYATEQTVCLSYMMFIALNPFSYAFGILRQTLALDILLFAVPMILEKRWVKATILVAIAFLCHRSAAVFIVLFLLSKVQVKKSVFMGVFLGNFALLAVAPFILNRFVLPMIQDWGEKEAAFDRLVEFRITNLYIILIAAAIFIYFFYDFKQSEEIGTNFMLWGFLLLLLIQPFSTYVDVYTRFQSYFIMLVTVFLPKAITSIKNKNIRFIAYGSAYFLLVIYMYFVFRDGSMLIYPYESIIA